MSSSLPTLKRITCSLIFALMVGLLSCLTVTATKTSRQTASDEVAINLADYGAIGDGVVDDGPALQSALDDLNALGGGTLEVPAGQYRLVTPVVEHFQPGLSVTIQGVPSNTPIEVAGNGRGLNLESEFVIAVGETSTAIFLSGLDSLLIRDLSFVGVQEVESDAGLVLGLSQISQTTVRHCEFYGLAVLGGDSIILAQQTNLSLEQTAFLGCSTNSGRNAPLIQNLSWLGISVRDCKFVDYGNRPGFFSKTPLQPPYAWVMAGNPIAPEPSHSRREAIFKNVFMDEGSFFAITVRPDRFSSTILPFEVYMSQLYVNVNNLRSDGLFIVGAQKVFIDRSHFGWSTRAGYAINLSQVGDAVLDLIDCTNDATRLKVAAERLTIINSSYTSLESGPVTKVIHTETPEEDPAQFVRQQYTEILGRDPDAVGHFYWTAKMLACDGAASCVGAEQSALARFLDTSPTEVFSWFGGVVDDDGKPLPDVLMSLTGSQSTAMNTDSSGNFHFDRLATAGEYQITPSKRHYVFQTRSIKTPNADVLTNFVGTLLRHTISGRILTTSGSPLAGATVVLSGGKNAIATSDVDGTYRFVNLRAGQNYTVAVSRTHYVFDDSSESFTDLSNDVTFSFTGRRLMHEISGVVTKADGSPLQGAALSLSGEVSATTTSDVNGLYRFENLGGGGNYTVTVSRQNYAFNNASQSFQDLSSDVTSNFKGTLLKYIISGLVKKPDGTPLVGASVELRNVSTISQSTDATGRYSFEVNAEANYTLTVRQHPYFFEPPSQTFEFLSGNKRTDFQALDPVVISGRIIDRKGVPLSGVSIALAGTLTASTQTDIVGKYSVVVRPGGGYNLTASKLNYSFDPNVINLTAVNGDQTCNFKATLNPGIPVLLAASDPTRALAIDAVLGTPEPFDFSYDYPWSEDRRTRLLLFVENIDLSTPENMRDLTAELEDSLHFIYPLTVEYGGKVEGVDLTDHVVVKLNDNLTASGAYSIRIKYRGVSSQALLIAVTVKP